MWHETNFTLRTEPFWRHHTIWLRGWLGTRALARSWTHWVQPLPVRADADLFTLIIWMYPACICIYIQCTDKRKKRLCRTPNKPFSYARPSITSHRPVHITYISFWACTSRRHSRTLCGAICLSCNRRCQTDATARRGVTTFNEASGPLQTKLIPEAEYTTAPKPRHPRYPGSALTWNISHTLCMNLLHNHLVLFALSANQLHGSARDVVFTEFTSHSTVRVHSNKSGHKPKILGGC